MVLCCRCVGVGLMLLDEFEFPVHCDVASVSAFCFPAPARKLVVGGVSGDFSSHGVCFAHICERVQGLNASHEGCAFLGLL